MGSNVRQIELEVSPMTSRPAAVLVTAVKRARAHPAPDRIHELRIAVRRLEASIGLAGPSAPLLPVPVGEVTRFARIAGALRDLDVTAAWLAGAYRPDPVPTGLAGRLRRARRRQMAAVTRRLGNRRSERALARLRSGPSLPIDGGNDSTARPSTAALVLSCSNGS